MFKKALASIIFATMAVSMLAGCGKTSGNSSNTSVTDVAELTGKMEFSDVRSELVYGNYLMNRKSAVAFNKDYAAFMENMETMDFDDEGNVVRLSKVPMEFEAGRYGCLDEDTKGFFKFSYPTTEDIQKKCDELVDKYGDEGVNYFQNYKKLLDYPYMVAKYVYVPDTGFDANNIQVATLEGFYKVSGNTVTIYWDEPDEKTYELKYEKPAATFEYEFKNGINLTLSNQGSKVNLLNYQFSDAQHLELFVEEGYIADASQALNNIIYIRKVNDDFVGTDIIFADGRRDEGAKMELNNDGTFKLTWEGIKSKGSMEIEETPGEINGEFVFANGSGLILNVEGKTYYYTNSESDYFGQTFDNINFEDMKNDDINELIETQINIKNELIEAFNQAGIEVTVDEKTGEVKADDSILFGVDESDVSEDGTAYLDTFIDVYTKVILPYVESGYVAEVEVAGHTDTNGSYDYNLELSKKRAKSVADYCTAKQPALGKVMKSEGFSYEYPVLDANGNVDMNASRRVVFSFKMGTGN